jgi:hypothetical protein
MVGPTIWSQAAILYMHAQTGRPDHSFIEPDPRQAADPDVSVGSESTHIHWRSVAICCRADRLRSARRFHTA